MGDKVAYHWIGEPGDSRKLTYSDLLVEVSKAANALLELGVQTGDVVAIYMPMIPELSIAMLACARIGAPHTVVFGGFTSDLPKTHSGKIMRRLLRDIGEGRALGDTTTLADAAVIETIRERSGAATEE